MGSVIGVRVLNVPEQICDPWKAQGKPECILGRDFVTVPNRP